MQTRRPHAKSRRGCLICKIRHVRCDETGPPCGRCKIRGDDCVYTDPKSSTNNSPVRTSTSERSLAYISARSEETTFPANRHLLELQLMHRWTTSTYKSCCTPSSGDHDVWQSWVPQLAIKHDFLLYGLLSITAFEYARLVQEPHSQRYLDSAAEYHGLALGSFRIRISNIEPNNIDSAVCMSLMLIVLAFASAQASATSLPAGETDGMVRTVLTHVELLRGCAPIIKSGQDYLSQNPYVQNLKPFEDLPRIPLDAHLEKAFTNLAELNDKHITSSIRDTEQRRMQKLECWEACKIALSLLRALYEKCVDDSTRGYALGWLNMAGDRFVQAVRNDDSVALLLLIYWGVLVERCGHQVWWADKFGSLLVDEIACRPLFEDSDALTKDLIQHARQSRSIVC